MGLEEQYKIKNIILSVDGYLQGEELFEIVSDMMRKVEIELNISQLEKLVEVCILLNFNRYYIFYRFLYFFTLHQLSVNIY